MEKVKVTILIDNYNGSARDYIKSYGFSALIEVDNQLILFDTGTKTQDLSKNLKTFGIKASEIDSIILSHNHFDHTDGLPAILLENESVPIYVHRDWDARASYNGVRVPNKNRRIIKKARALKEISERVLITNSHLSIDYGGIIEQACFIKASNSYIFICGCCHPGLVSFFDDRYFLNIPLDASLHIMGGMHGFYFLDDEASELNPHVKSIILCHCTQNEEMFLKQFGNKCKRGIVGETLSF